MKQAELLYALDRANRDCTNPQVWKKPSEIKAFAKTNWEHLLKLKMYNTIPCRKVSSFDGWVTVVTENGTILSGYAGDFTC